MQKEYFYLLVIFFPYFPICYYLVSKIPVQSAGEITISKQKALLPSSLCGIIEYRQLYLFNKVKIAVKKEKIQLPFTTSSFLGNSTVMLLPKEEEPPDFKFI